MLPGMELLSCPGMAVPREVMHHVVQVESSYNPYAIGVVGGHLVRQPQNLSEAVATVRMLETRGFNFSVGLAQVNRYNLGKYGLTSYGHAFEICPNLQAGSRILAECYQRHRDWGKSFSCYYSGNPVTGYRHGYVRKVFASIAKARRAGDPGSTDMAAGIPVVPNPSRRTVQVEHFLPQPASRAGTTSASRISPPNAATAGPEEPQDPAFVRDGIPHAATAAQEPSIPAEQASTIPPVVTLSRLEPASDGPVLLQPAPLPATEPLRPTRPASKGDQAFVF